MYLFFIKIISVALEIHELHIKQAMKNQIQTRTHLRINFFLSSSLHHYLRFKTLVYITLQVLHYVQLILPLK